MSMEKDTQELKKFSFRGRSVVLAGLGAGSSLRGLNIKLQRPDLIIMDDLQSKEQAASEAEANKIFGWMLGTLLKANDKSRCLFVFLGNMYPYEGSILKKLKTNPQWISFICGAILEDGESLWPELRSVDDILAELEHDESMGHSEIFYSEVMNDDVAGSRSGVDFSKINVWHDDKAKPIFPQAGFVIIDPSAGKKKSDDVVIGACLIYDGEPVLREIVMGKLSPGEQVDESIKLAAKWGLQAIVVEDVAYQSTLMYWMQLRITQLGLTMLKVLSINPRGMAKNSRIAEMLKQLVAPKQRVWVHVNVRSIVIYQITYFDMTKKINKDDILDIMAYFYQVMLLYKQDLLIAFEHMQEPTRSSFSEDLQLEF